MLPRMLARPSVPEPGTGDFLGRDRELLALRDGLAQARSRRGGLFLIGGEPGIGKSRLVDEFARERANRAPACFGARAGRGPVPRPTGRGCRLCAPTCARSSLRLLEPRWARGRPISHADAPGAALAVPGSAATAA